jgi:hypothetical protein
MRPSCVCGYTIIQADLFDDLAVFEAKHRRSCEMHFATSCGRQGASQKVAKCRAGVRTSCLPATDYIIALGDEVGSSPEIEIWESFPEVRHKRLDIITAATGLMQRVLQGAYWVQRVHRLC